MPQPTLLGSTAATATLPARQGTQHALGQLMLQLLWGLRHGAIQSYGCHQAHTLARLPGCPEAP